ncbi:MAG: hypothetical protein JXR25_14225 [Pontiellaceae bacterium]|nr:hypothetical protein [Pontiellaceae bacterium]MBN2785975.1 hypothetical protein [Pontiellaceae bacterium]
MLKNKRLLLLTLVLIIAATVVLGMRVAYPYHRLTAFVLLGLGWLPLIASYRMNRQVLRVQKKIIKKKTRPYLPHAVVAIILVLAFYITGSLFPVEKSPLVNLRNLTESA